MIRDMHLKPRPVRLRDYYWWVILGPIALTLLFAAQQVVRRRAAGAPAGWGTAVAFNALDWIAWACVVPALVRLAQGARLDRVGNRLQSILSWTVAGVASIIAVSLATGIILRTWPTLFLGPSQNPQSFDAPLGSFLLAWTVNNSAFNTLFFGLVAGAIHAALYRRDLDARLRQQAELEAKLTHAELAILRMQLQPHFFFNALHTISSLMVSDVPAAQSVIAALGSLLRASLDHTARQEITLDEELAFADMYLQIQRARFRHRLNVQVSVDDGLRKGLVPSLMLQLLLENAVRHGIEPHPAGGNILVCADRRDDTLEITVRDEAPERQAAPVMPTTGGVGLANLEARLFQLYGGRAQLSTTRDTADAFVARVRLPFHVDHGQYPAAATFR